MSSKLLSVKAVAAAKPGETLNDGDGLYLRVSDAGRSSFRTSALHARYSDFCTVVDEAMSETGYWPHCSWTADFCSGVSPDSNFDVVHPFKKISDMIAKTVKQFLCIGSFFLYICLAPSIGLSLCDPKFMGVYLNEQLS